MVEIPSPAIAIVGRHNSGKTTLIERLIATMSARGFDVGSVKHHSHKGFDIDIPGKDSYRHRAAGATETVIAAPGQMARIATVDGELECADIVASMPGHDIVIVEGYRKSGLPTIEIMRQENKGDRETAAAFAQAAREGASLDTDFTHAGRMLRDARRKLEQAGGNAKEADISFGSAADKMPSSGTVAVVTDIPEAIEAAKAFGIPAFGLDDIDAIADFLEEGYVRQRITVVIQAGGESRRMGRSKATVPFCGRPLIMRLVERVAPVADELIITTNEPDNLEFLHDEYPELRIRLVTDAYDFRGALPGMCTAFNAASNEYVATVACDMVFASPRLIVAEAQAMEESGADVVIPVNKHGFEPFHALYRRSVCAPVACAGVAEGDKRAQYILDKVNVRRFTQREVLAAEPHGMCFVNANRPNELEALERLVQENE